MASRTRNWGWSFFSIARSTRHFLDVLDDLNRIGVEFVSFREQIDTGGPLGRAIVIIIGAIAELERNLIIEVDVLRPSILRRCVHGHDES